MYKPTRHSYEKRMKNQRRKAKAGLLLATTLTAGMAVNPCPAVAGLASYLTGTGNVSVVQAAETLSISKENVTKINISEQTPEEVWGDMQIKIVLDTPGTYLLEGSNYINESYIDTQITVPEGVEVNIILADGFSINNDDANYVWGCGYAGSTLGVNPFVIKTEQPISILTAMWRSVVSRHRRIIITINMFVDCLLSVENCISKRSKKERWLP